MSSWFGFTAVIQSGAIFAAVLYFFTDIVRLVRGFVGGVTSAEKRSGGEFRFALAVGVCGFIGLDPH